MKNQALKRCLILFSLNLVTSYFVLTAQISTNFLPQTPAYSKNVSTFNYQRVSQGFRLAAVSLQGLVNRDTARIFLRERNSEWLFDLYKSQGVIQNEYVFTDIYSLLKKYRSIFKGAVVIDTTKNFTVNLATNIAGVEDRIIITPDMLTTFKQNFGTDVDVKDLREYNFNDALSAFNWYELNVLPQQPKNVLGLTDAYYMHDVYRDYLIQFKIPTFWLPGPTDADYNLEYENKIINLLTTTPPNTPVLGFWPGVDKSGKSVGYPEYKGVKLAGKYGKYTLVNTWVGNYSFHSSLNDQQASFKQNKVRAKKFRDYNPAKKYVALIMIESGDSPAYLQYGLNQRQWSDPKRGQVPISYGISPSIRYLLPELTKYLYNTATENDFFFCSISGAGYCYPFEGYCDLTDNPAKNKRDYFNMTAENMALLDLDMMGLYTHPGSKWTDSDLQIAKTYIEPMKGLKSIVSGMHRIGYTGVDGNEILDSVTVHHTLTFWPTTTYQWDDSAQDLAAVNSIENEIKTYGAGGNFIQAMFYSWTYGPRRLKLLMDRMEAQGYEFVTLNEFDYLNRVANGWKQFTALTNTEYTKSSPKLNCYPNPTKGILNFSQPLNGVLTCNDSNGKFCKKFNCNNTSKIDISAFVKGVYILTYKDLKFRVVLN
jgi:hypothetical protein